MNSIITKTLQHLTAQNQFEKISEDQISGIVHEFPFFAPSQLLFSLKLKQDENYKSATQLKRSALFFNNPEWLMYHLQDDSIMSFEIPTYDEKLKHPDTEEYNSKPIVAASETTASQHFQHIEIPTLEEVKGIMTGYSPTEPIETKSADVIDEPAIQATTEAPIAHNAFSVDEYDEDLPEEQENDYVDESTDHNFSISIPQAITNQLADAKAGLNKTIPAESLDIQYDNEPYHAVDYFDSQGIKLDLSKLPQDRLTKQLLKFTDWLKHMKTVNPNPNDLGTEPELETKVVNIAQHSNDSKEVYTETMADVYAKQGKMEKAIQIYIKLSFLHPDKTAFFAKKIQELKGI